MIRIKYISLFLLLLLFTENSFSQNRITFNHLGIENGLSHSSVTCIFQDKQGFMWFGTQDGLNRYDGYSFKIFRNNPSDSTTLRENFIFSIYESTDGILYFETQHGIFHKYDPHNESFIVINKESVNLYNAKLNSVFPILEDPSGVKWTGGLSKGTGLTMSDKKGNILKEYKNNPSDPSSISHNEVYSIFRDRSGTLWIGTLNGLDKLDENSGKFIHYRNEKRNQNSLPDNWVWPVFQDSHGQMWVGTVKSGLCKFSPQTGTFITYKNNPSDPSSISDNFIFSIFEDRSGVIWIGTNAGGINFFHSSSQVFEQYFHSPGNKNNISDNNVLSLYADKKNNYWAGTRNNGLDKINLLSSAVKNYSRMPDASKKLPTNSVQFIYEDKSGILWLGTFADGLIAFDPEKETFKSYTNSQTDTNSISDNRIMAIIEDKEDYLWIGTYGSGLNKLNRNTNTITRYRFSNDNPNSISSDNVWSLLEDVNGNIWIGTFGAGASLYDKRDNSFKHFRNDPKNPKSVADNNIIRIFQDSKGDIWFGTTKGLSKFSAKTGEFKNYNEEDGLANNFVFGILEDNKGNLWLSTNNGLSRFNPEDETFRNFYSQDGLLSNEFNQSAFAKDNISGKLLFGTPNGFNVFHPDSILENKYPPPIVLTEYLRYNTDDEEGKPIIEKGISVRDSIFLTYKDNIITLRFAALSFYNNLDNQYRYKLEGFNDNWIQLGTNHSVTFTNLEPGEYNLRIIGSNNDGVWNEEGTSLFIEVLPPWWRTKIAYTSYAVLFLSLLYGLRRFELNRREQKARMREKELQLKATQAEKRAIEVENERKTKELEEARQLQLSMLPKELPVLPDLEIAAFMRTATEVGGDYYDFLYHPDGTLNIAFGDATGHGLQAGTMVTLMKGFFTSDAARLEITDFMNHCSNMIKEIKLGRILMSFSLLRIANKKLSVTSAGMPPIYFFNNKEKQTEEILIQGMPLGAMRKFSYKVTEKEMNSGDTVLLLTDGLPEQMNAGQEMFDYIRVKELFNSLADKNPDEIIKGLIKSGEEWMNGTSQTDDISFVVLKVK